MKVKSKCARTELCNLNVVRRSDQRNVAYYRTFAANVQHKHCDHDTRKCPQATHSSFDHVFGAKNRVLQARQVATGDR